VHFVSVEPPPKVEVVPQGMIGTQSRRRGQALTAAEKKEYRRIVGELQKLPHRKSSKYKTVADRLQINVAVVVKAAKWGRKHRHL
jgi:hypothetical protein